MESALHFLVFFAVGHHNTGCGTADESNAADGGDHQQNHLPPRDNVDNDAVTAQTVEVPIMNDVAEERVEIPILLDGRFVLEGTLKLNEPFEGK